MFFRDYMVRFMGQGGVFLMDKAIFAAAVCALTGLPTQ